MDAQRYKTLTTRCSPSLLLLSKDGHLLDLGMDLLHYNGVAVVTNAKTMAKMIEAGYKFEAAQGGSEVELHTAVTLALLAHNKKAAVWMGEKHYPAMAEWMKPLSTPTHLSVDSFPPIINYTSGVEEDF
jgi:hypothetical protein